MAYHKFKFYEQRKNDPKWRPYYLEAMRKGTSTANSTT